MVINCLILLDIYQITVILTAINNAIAIYKTARKI